MDNSRSRRKKRRKTEAADTEQEGGGEGGGEGGAPSSAAAAPALAGVIFGTETSRINALVGLRDKHRLEKQWAAADDVKRQLDTLDVVVHPQPGGAPSKWRRKGKRREKGPMMKNVSELNMSMAPTDGDDAPFQQDLSPKM